MKLPQVRTRNIYIITTSFFSMPSADGFSILFLQTPYAPTHVKLLFSLVKELVDRGHWVTTVR